MSLACDAALSLFAIAFSWDSGCRIGNSRSFTNLANRRMRSVGSFRGFYSRASVGQCPYWVRRCSMCAWVRYPLSVSLFIERMSCFNPIRVAMSLMDGKLRPSSLSGRCTPSGGKLGRRLIARRMALLSMPSIIVSCRSLSTLRCVA